MKLKIENKKKVEFKIINSMKKGAALWESIPCTKTHHKSNPCEFCRCEIAWESVPRESFTKRGKQINKITLVRGSHEDIQGWII